ncbi:unnamed protein product [Caenorhabditis angaria]|uniref:Uncharacterized protein n=1 Tax=Caenorhabditis angaria TaxID=860376 RepID=A0A9P1IPC8_9PELO|nr:unnamed protein product [Caenorhabditis angaria]
MQPILLFPILAGYTNGILWTRFKMSSHLQMNFPSSLNILSLENVDMYDMNINPWFMYTVITIVIMLSISSISSITVSFRMFKILNKKRRILSEKNFKNHRNSIISLLTQATLPMLVVIIPMAVLNYFFIRVTPNSQTISNLMMLIYSFHSSLSTLVMILSDSNYRKLINSKIRPNSISLKTAANRTRSSIMI